MTSSLPAPAHLVQVDVLHSSSSSSLSQHWRCSGGLRRHLPTWKRRFKSQLRRGCITSHSAGFCVCLSNKTKALNKQTHTLVVFKHLQVLVCLFVCLGTFHETETLDKTVKQWWCFWLERQKPGWILGGFSVTLRKAASQTSASSLWASPAGMGRWWWRLIRTSRWQTDLSVWI